MKLLAGDLENQHRKNDDHSSDTFVDVETQDHVNTNAVRSKRKQLMTERDASVEFSEVSSFKCFHN
jgi:hypothetical protein